MVDLQQENSDMVLKQTSVCEYNKPLPKELLHLFLNNEDKKSSFQTNFYFAAQQKRQKKQHIYFYKNCSLGSADGCRV